MTPFRKLLIANRGEIALRVMRSARALGLRSVAVYSTADASSRHVCEADQAVCIGGALPAESYLNVEAILAAARASGADAVHPGYGFLAENARFARACIDAGLIFIGPSPEAIEAMGDKAVAKRRMLEAGVPCVPSYEGDDQSERRLGAEAERIGWPVMIKAVAGGGGRGMRLVASAGEFAEALRSARSEAMGAFDDDRVLLEQAVLEPRHIEIQVFADRHGNAIHLGERDCSIQRRHQKLVEEAPSPAVSPALRERMGATAVAAIKAIGYEGAGTLEFLLDREGRYYFMEMNPRLQVEHPVTEAITGLDLVELQLRIAAGEALPLAQDELSWRGHAIEVRLCAEDADFRPHSGTMCLWAAAPQLRVEHALASGCEIAPFYDSMIAKLVAHGATREEARRKLLAGLQDTVALGVRTNQGLLRRCLEHDIFVQGEATTAFIAQALPELTRGDERHRSQVRALAAVLLRETGADAPVASTRRLACTLPAVLRYDIDGHSYQVTVRERALRRYAVEHAESHHEIEVIERDGDQLRCDIDGVVERIFHVRDGHRLSFSWDGSAHEVVDSTLTASERSMATEGDGKLRASVSGRVVAVLVQESDTVGNGQSMVVLEAMKMEHVHATRTAGIVTAIHVALNDQVSAGRVLAEVMSEVPA